MNIMWVCMASYKPNHSLMLWFPFEFYDCVSDIWLSDDPDIKLSLVCQWQMYSKTCVKRQLSKRQKIVF